MMTWVWCFITGAAVLHCANANAMCKKYLTDYEWLDPHKDNTEEDVRDALIAFQMFNIDFGSNVTGVCDDKTMEIMKRPRCGCEDTGKNDFKLMVQNLIGPQEYHLGSTKWRKRVLTWTVTKYPRRNSHLSNAEVDSAMRRGLEIWSKETNLQFQQVRGSNADIRISFEIRRHTSQPPFYDFDGKSGVLAHAFFPESGIVHFDDEEDYVLNSQAGTELYIVAAHEFGHTLGISHSNVKSALMAPYYRYSERLELDYDDKMAVQALYGRRTNPVPTKVTTRATNPTPRPTNRPTTRRPTTRRTTTRRSSRPDQCSMKIDASFRIGSVTYIFTQEMVGRHKKQKKTYVYKVYSSGIDLSSRKHISDMFKSRGTRTFRREYPYEVDAATYVPHNRQLFLFSGTKVYRYTVTSLSQDVFYIDSDQRYPKWINVAEFPERPTAAIAMKYYNSRQYYMMVFSETMMWIWDFYSERVGAWAYPIKILGQLMPQRIDTAFSYDEETVYMVRGQKVYEFNMLKRRVLSVDNIKDVISNFLKGPCI